MPRIKERPKIMNRKQVMDSSLKHGHVQVKKEEIESIEKKEEEIERRKDESME